jgi:hypothetical protein
MIRSQAHSILANHTDSHSAEELRLLNLFVTLLNDFSTRRLPGLLNAYRLVGSPCSHPGECQRPKLGMNDG